MNMEKAASICTIDVAIPAMHGLHEDGTPQGVFRSDIPYSSAGVVF